MSLTALLDRSLTIERQTATADARGGTVLTFAAIATNVPCAISPASASVTTDYARRDMIVDHHVYTTANLDAILPNGLQLGDRFSDGSAHYLVKAVKKNANAQITGEVLYEADCEKRT